MNITDTQKDFILILIIDDDKFMRIQLRHAMEQAGYQVAEAQDGEEGLALCTRLQPDIILLDALMLGIDGFTCCQKLKTLPGNEQTPILIITAVEDEESVDKAFDAGATDYITKPIHWAVLRQRVRRLLEAKRGEEELRRQNLRMRLFAEVALKIRQSLNLEEILQTTVTEVQKLLGANRVLIFQLWPKGFGKVVTEASDSYWASMLDQNLTDEYFETEYLNKYHQGRVYTITDVATAQIPTCLTELMQQFNIKAKLCVPILLKQKLWGLLIAHQCNHPRQWSNFEIELLGNLADQIGIALAQAQMLEQETKQRQELARSNAELEQFAYVASHDLQEPLRKIQAFGDRLKTKYHQVLTDQGRDYLDRMQNAASRMQALIDDLLTFSRITSKAQPFTTVNLNQVAQEVVSDLEVCIEHNGGTVEVGELPIIEAEPIQMYQLLQNLISNALKFHQKGDRPVVKVHGMLKQKELSSTGDANPNEQCQIMVQDNGIGFDEMYLDRIFNFFQRLHGRSEYEGTGMGLAICRRIVEFHGGSISAESTLGQGATFMVTLPVKQAKGENPR